MTRSYQAYRRCLIIAVALLIAAGGCMLSACNILGGGASHAGSGASAVKSGETVELPSCTVFLPAGWERVDAEGTVARGSEDKVESVNISMSGPDHNADDMYFFLSYTFNSVDNPSYREAERVERVTIAGISFETREYTEPQQYFLCGLKDDHMLILKTVNISLDDPELRTIIASAEWHD